MPKLAKHDTWVNRNISFYQYCLKDSDFKQDWSVVALFYAALHKAQYLLELNGEDPRTHIKRLEKIGELFPNLFDKYFTLYNKSRQARYSCKLFDDRKVRTLKQNVFDPLIADIDDEITKLTITPSASTSTPSDTPTSTS